MSRLGKKLVHIPEKVDVEFSGGVLNVKGPMGMVSQVIDKRINIKKVNDNNIFIETLGDSREHNAFRGLTRGLVVNMFEGVTRGFKKELEAIGLGYKINVENDKKLVMAVGFSHMVSLDIPLSVKVTVTLTSDKNILISVTGIDKCEVGAFAAKIRDVKPPDAYKGFGVRYLGEKIIKKAGKTATSSGKK
ncbi:MAG: 50S ribosomal protein L6 [Endomicrobium sp.]|jgi:large subunit ribosomal protein L6|nr:50S ribosomal protein L6 [Endomicrobium sp.]